MPADGILGSFSSDFKRNMEVPWISYPLVVLWPLQRLGLGWYGDEPPDRGWTTWRIRKRPVVGRFLTLLFFVLTLIGFAIQIAFWSLIVAICFVYTLVVFPFHALRGPPPNARKWESHLGPPGDPGAHFCSRCGAPAGSTLYNVWPKVDGKPVCRDCRTPAENEALPRGSG